jgi:hypothetical protein
MIGQEINAITFGGVKCYLIKTHQEFILVDTGYTKNAPRQRKNFKEKVTLAEY